MAEPAFPFVEVTIDTSAIAPVAARSPGVIAVVGTSSSGAAAANVPVAVEDSQEAAEAFALGGGGALTQTALYQSLLLALGQNPRPQKIYGVKVADSDYADALAGLEGADDVSFVALANEADVGATGSPPTGVVALKEHVEFVSNDGQRRIGVAMVDPAIAKTVDYVDNIQTEVEPLRSDTSRMVMVAARGSTQDAATAAMAAIAAYPPHISPTLKRVRGIDIPLQSQYAAGEIKALSTLGINAIIDPALMPGPGLHLADGRCLTSDEDLAYVDMRRILDFIEERLKAGLIGTVGDARITKSGLTLIKTRAETILGVLQTQGMIDGFTVRIDVLDILSMPESARTGPENERVRASRESRSVDMHVIFRYGPAAHHVLVTLAPAF